MGKVAVYNLRPFDEAEWFETYARELGIGLVPARTPRIWTTHVWLKAANAWTSSPPPSTGS